MPKSKQTYTASEKLAVSELPQVVGDEESAQRQNYAKQGGVRLIFLDRRIHRFHRRSDAAVEPVKINFFVKTLSIKN
jgi:hypothetical protein